MIPSIRRVVAFIAILFCAPTCWSAEIVRYVLLTSDGSPGGEQVVERSDDGAVHVRFIFKDNGRGPELAETIRMRPDGFPERYDVVGSAESGGQVDEHFAQTDGQASWTSPSGRGEVAASKPALYIPLNSSYEPVSISLRLLAESRDGQIPLWPSGTLTQKVVDRVDVTNGDRTRHLELVVQTGLGLTPAFYWSVAEPKARLFAAIVPGYTAAIEEGWTAHLRDLEQRQRAAESVVLKDLSRRMLRPLAGVTAIRNVRIFDSDTARLRGPQDIYVLRDRIVGIRPAGESSMPVDHDIDAAGRIVLPGLFDMHTHNDRWGAGLHLAAGVTTVRDLGNNNADVQAMLDEQARGELLLPHLVPCGFLEGDSPFAKRLGIVIRTRQEALDAVDWYALHGYPQLKIYNSFPRALVRETVAYAHARGMRVSGHVPAFMRAQDVVVQGYDEIQHINQVLLNFLVTPTTDTRTLARAYLPAERLATFDFDTKQVADFIALLKRHRTVIDPTLGTFDFIKQRDGTMSEPYAPIADHLPPDIQRNLFVGGMKIPDDATAARYARSYAKMVEFVGRLDRAGIPLVAGTDSTPGFGLQAEFALYVKAGIPPARVLQIATRNGALYSRTSADRGSIEVGKRADLVLVDGDPTTDIADIRKVALVLTQGGVIDPSAVYRELGIRPFVDRSPAVRDVQAVASAQ